jgi:lipoate-protein ligase A
MGVPVVFNHTNDLFVAGGKISGNAQFSNTRRILVHGTLLFDSNLEHLQRALNAQANHITSMARKSVQSRVTNISLYLKNSFDLKEFRKRLLETVAGLCGGMKTMHLEDNQWQAIERLSQEKYRSWDWNYGKAPVFQINRLGHNSAGRLGYSMDVENGCITVIRFEKEGTVFIKQTKIEDRLTGVPFRREAIRARLKKLDSKVFGWRLTAEQVADLLAADLGQTNNPVLQTPRRDLF